MLRKLGVGIIATALLAPGFASALGIGDYQLDSYLNQPLSMDVQLLEARDLSSEEIKVSLASQEDFDRAGLERIYFLTGLDFSVELEDDGTGRLHIKSSQPVREPFLSFLIEIRWPTGRMLREYTVLLDPPSYEPDTPSSLDEAQIKTTSAPSQPVEQAQPVTVAEPVKVVQDASVQATSQVSADAYQTSTQAASHQEYVVKNSDTMWRIAANHRADSSVSIQQMLVAIQEMNPEAFINGNVNLVREGQVLRIPTEQEVRRISTRDALKEVAEQNRQWEKILQEKGIPVPKPAQVDGRRASGEEKSAAGAYQQGEVTLLAGDEGDSAATSATGNKGVSGGSDTRALENELAIREEGLDSLRRENAELKSRLDDLSDQVTTSEKLLQLRNDQIARLQAQLNELQKAQGLEVTQPEAPAELEGLEKQALAETGEEEATNASDGDVTSQQEAASDTVGQVAENDSDSAVGTEASTDVAVSEPVKRPTGEKAVEPAKAPPAPTKQPEQASAGLVDMLMANLLYIVSALVALLLVLGGIVFMAKRNKQKALDAEGENEEELYEDSALQEDEYGAAFSEDEDLGAFEDEAQVSEDRDQEPAQDPLEEVEVYVAYGRYPQALDFLRKEIEKSPARADLRLKLLEVLVEMNDQSAFESESQALLNIDNSASGQVEALRAKFDGEALASEDDVSLDDLEMDLASDDFGASSNLEEEDEDATLVLDQQASSVDDVDDFALELDEDASEADDDTGTFALSDDLDFSDNPESASEAPEQEDMADLDFDLPETSEATEKADEESHDLSFDLDEEFDLAGADEDEPAELDVSMDGVSEEFAQASEKPVEEEALDLSLDELSLEDDEAPTVTAEALDFDSAPEEVAEFDESTESPTQEAEAIDFDLSDFAEDETLALEQQDEASPEDELSLDDFDLPADESADQEVEETLELDTGADAFESDEPSSDEDDFDFLSESDENATKLDLAKAYIDMGDSEGAKDILNEVLEEGNEDQKSEAKELLKQVS